MSEAFWPKLADIVDAWLSVPMTARALPLIVPNPVTRKGCYGCPSMDISGTPERNRARIVSGKLDCWTLLERGWWS
jgi:hypothetical protein